MHRLKSKAATTPTDDRVLLNIAIGLPPVWTPIGVRPRDSIAGQRLRWQETPDAPLGIEEAQKLVAARQLVMANRHERNRVVLVVRPVAEAL